jgi:O-antigen ligase
LIEPWFWERFRGWSENPNQLAFVCLVLGLTSLHLAETAERTGKRMIALTCLALSIIVGRLSQSDTFTLAMLAAGPIFLVARARVSLAERRGSFQSAFSWIAVIGLPLLLSSLLPFALSNAGDVGRLSAGLEKNGGKEAGQEADLRLTLWGEAITVGVQSGMLGLGPGPHLPIPPSIVVGRTSTVDTSDNIPHPDQGAAPNFEAHNTALDLLTQGGLIGMLSFLWLMGTALAVTLKQRRAGLTTLLCGLAIFGTTNLIVRPPLFWFAVAVCLAEREWRVSSDVALRRDAQECVGANDRILLA